MTKDPIDVALGERLRQIRSRRGLSMSFVGRHLGITYQQISKYEDGENRISASTLFRLAELLDVEIGIFFQDLPGQGRDAEDATGADTSAQNDVLDKIADPEVRQHLTGLLRALNGRR